MTQFAEMIRAPGLKLGTYIGEFAGPGWGALLKSAGCDFAFVDMEHSGFSFETVKALLRSLQDAGIATVLRPPSDATHHISRACDMGAQGIMPPMMATAARAQAVIDAINYAPVGKRGAIFGVAHDDYTPRPVTDAIAFCNAKTAFVALIETAEGIDTVEEIAALDGTAALWIGHFDLSNSLGIPGEFDNPRFTQAVERVMAAGRAHGKPVGRLVTSPEEGRAKVAEGASILCYSGDVWLLRSGLVQGFAAIRGEGA